MKTKRIILFSLFIVLFGFFTFSSEVVFAAESAMDNTKMVSQINSSFSDVFGKNFTNDLSTLFKSFQWIARTIVILMTALAGIMIAFGLGGANQMFFKWIFGIGVVANIADFSWSLFGDPYWVNGGEVNTPDASAEMEKIAKLHAANETDTEWYNVFSNFMNYYSKAFIVPAYARLMPIAVKLTLVLWMIDTAMKVALGITQQDLINFFTKQILKLGIYIFLITNWWNPTVGGSSTGQAYELSKTAGGNMQIMVVLGDGFESLGYYAAGGDDDELKDSDGKKVELQSNNIFKNTMALWSALWGSLTKDNDKDKNAGFFTNLWNGFKATLQTLSSPMIMMVDIIMLISVICMLIYVALEMFMVRVEFYTMAVLSVMLLPFAMIDQLKFLADKAISLMFNLAIKCFVMAFLSVGIVKILTEFVKKVRAEGENNIWTEWWLDWTLIIQLVLLVGFLTLLTKKIPQLCNGLLSGNPSLSGGDLMQQMTQTVKVAGMVAAAGVTGGASLASGAAAGVAAAKAGGGGLAKQALGGVTGGLKGGFGAFGRGIGNYALTQNPLAQGFKQGMNLFSGGNGAMGLMQAGATGALLGLSDGQSGGLMDRMNPDKKAEGSTNNNASNAGKPNINTAGGKGKGEGEKTIEKQIGTVSEKHDQKERVEQKQSDGNPSSGNVAPIVGAAISPDRNTNGGNSDKNKDNPSPAPPHPSFVGGNSGTPIPAFNNTLSQGSSGGLSYSKLPTSNPKNVSADGQFTKAMVSSPKGGRNVVAWVPSASPDTGTVSTKNLIKHPKK